MLALLRGEHGLDLGEQRLGPGNVLSYSGLFFGFCLLELTGAG